MKRKICVTTGTRADYGLLRPILHRILQSKKLDLHLIVTGMHLSKKHGMTINEIRKDGFRIQTKIPMLAKNDSNYSITKELGRAVVSFAETFHKIQPDINLVLGDRDEMLASAIAAYHMNIPNAHVHGGDKSGGLDEYTRHAITKLSNIHFAATKKSKQRIIEMGENPKRVFFTGSPGIDEIVINIAQKSELEEKLGIKLTGQEIVVLYHPVTTQIETALSHISNILKAVSFLKNPVIAIAPNSDAGNKVIFKQLTYFAGRYDFIKMYPNLTRSDYLGLLNHCGVLIGNSSSGVIEGSYFDIPVINVGTRQQNRERGNNVTDVDGNSFREIRSALKKSLDKKHKFKNANIYGDGTAAKKIVKIFENLQLDQDLLSKQICY